MTRTPELACCTTEYVDTHGAGHRTCSHAVRLYADERALAEHAAQFLILGFLAGEAAVLVVTPGRCDAIEAALRQRDIDPVAVQRSGTLHVIDAEECVEAIIRSEGVDPGSFESALGTRLRQVSRGHSGVRVFSEAAALLWARGDRDRAMGLEQMWGAVCAAESCNVLCAYPETILPLDSHDGGRMLAAHSEATLPAAAVSRDVPWPNTGNSGRAVLRALIDEWSSRVAPFALALLDLDDFHVINQEFGCDFGDEVLAAVRGVLSGAVRKGDRVIPCVGDRFGVMLANVCDAAGARSAVRKLKSALVDPLRIRGREVYVTVTCGVVVRAAGSEPQDWLTAATSALHDAKTHRAHKAVIRQSASATASRGRHMPTLLRKALERGELEVHYQPRIEASSGRVTGAEALLRWHSSELGWVPPAHFIPAAERSGLILPIGEWVLETACRQAVEWQERSLEPFTVAVNVSACQLFAPGLTTGIRRILDSSGLPPEALELELTETAVMDRVSSNIEKLRAVRALGVSLAVDDFGTGYSSLSYLTRLPVQVLKIDRSFVAEMTREREACTLVGAIVGLSQSLGLTTVAEGVETQEQLAAARALRCDEVQGFLFGRPVPPSEFERVHLSRVRTAA